MKLPQILDSSIVAKSQIFSVEALRLRFSNGVERVFERLPQRIGRAVIVCALNEKQEVILVREYMAGIHKYELGLPKGRVEPEEDLEVAANRELMEEAGFGARSFTYLKELTVAPSHMGYSVHAFLGTDLYEESLEGDEPEPLEIVYWPLSRLGELMARDDFSEARSLATLMLVRAYLAGSYMVGD